MATKRSCSDALHRLQDEYGLTNGDLKKAVRDAVRPREVKLPTYRMRLTKDEKRRAKLQDRASRIRKYDLAYWLLEEFLEPEYANEIYREHPDFKDLVNHASKIAMNMIRMIGEEHAPTDLNEVFPPEPDDEFDIPEIHAKEFRAFEKEHPPRKDEGIIEYRNRFRKHLKKRRRRYYSKKHMKIYDPLFAMTAVNEKKMIENLKRISKENEYRTREFHRMLDKLYGNNAIGSEQMERFKKRTEDMQAAARRRLKGFLRRAVREELTPITFEFPDGHSEVSYGI